MCLIEEVQGRPAQVMFPSASDLELQLPNPTLCAQAIRKYCRQQRIPIVFLDGPQGWKDSASQVEHPRLCEKILNTPAKTETPGQVKPKNYTTFVSLSIDIFSQLVESGAVLVSEPIVTIPSNRLLVVESFPLTAWRTLNIRPLPAKSKAKDSDLREWLQKLRQILGFRIQRAPTHDELQALVAGLAGVAILAGNTRGYIAQGAPPKKHDGVIVEGFIVNPRLDSPPKTQRTTDNGRRTTDRGTT